MISNGILVQGILVITPSHGEEELSKTEKAFDKTCAVLRQAYDVGTVEGLLIGPPMKPVFRRIL